MGATDHGATDHTADIDAAGHGAADHGREAEDAKLLVLARSAAARVAGGGAAVRDDIGRTYLAGAVAAGPLRLSAVEAAVAQAVGSGATRLEAVAVVGDEAEPDPALLAAVGDPTVVRA